MGELGWLLESGDRSPVVLETDVVSAAADLAVEDVVAGHERLCDADV